MPTVIDAAPANETARHSTDTDASGSLHVTRQGRRSVVTRACARSPLRLLTPANHGDAAWVFTSTYGGGLVGGDAVRLAVDIGPDATMLLQTQASTKVYRSPDGASSALDARVAEGGQLLVLPDPTVCFDGASFEQDQQIDLARGASAVVMDWLTAGRRASGERWAFDRYVSRLRIRYDGELVLGDAVHLSATDGPLVERMGRFDCLCLIAMAGPHVRPFAAAAAADVLLIEARSRAAQLAAIAPIGDAGCVIRIAGESVEAVGRAARGYLRFVPALLGDDPWTRKW